MLQRRDGGAEPKKLLILADLLANRRDELLADFQDAYGLDATRIGKEIDVIRAAALAAQLRPGARVWRGMGEGLAWGLDCQMLAAIECWAHRLWWSMTEDARSGGNPPDPIHLPRPGESAPETMDADELARALARPRRAVTRNG